MKKPIFLIITLILFNYCFGQTYKLLGKIIDSNTNDPLPYATIEIFSLKTGTISERDGKFSMAVASKDAKSDSVEFSYLGYEKMKLCLAEIIDAEQVIILKEKPILLEEVKILPKEYYSEIVGIRDKEPSRGQYTGAFGANKGNFLENKNKQAGWIKSVNFFLHKDGYPSCPFRIRIYKVGENHKPAEDLLNENLVVSAEKSGWFRIDVANYNIPFPKEGVFIMMEWINSGEAFFFEKEVTFKRKNERTEKVKRKYYGQSLGTVKKKGGVFMWGNTLGNEWIPYDFNRKGYNINAMINAEIAYEKK